MKKLLTLVLFACAAFGQAQLFSSEILNEDIPLTWLGLDFTEAQFVEDFNHVLDEEEIVKLFEVWNESVISNRKKYQLEKTFRRNSITRNIEIINRLNAQLQPSEIVSRETHLLYSDDIRRAFNRYNLSTLQKGFAFSYVVESVDAVHREFSGYMVAIDVAENRVIKTYYVKVRFAYAMEDSELITPFKNVLSEFSDMLREAKSK